MKDVEKSLGLIAMCVSLGVTNVRDYECPNNVGNRSFQKGCLYLRNKYSGDFYVMQQLF